MRISLNVQVLTGSHDSTYAVLTADIKKLDVSILHSPASLHKSIKEPLPLLPHPQLATCLSSMSNEALQHPDVPRTFYW